MELEIVPSICKVQKDEETGAEIAPLFKGSVTIRLPEMPEVFRFKAKYGKALMKTEIKKAETDEEKEAAKFEAMELVALIAEDIRKFWIKVDLHDVEMNRDIKSVDELYTYERGFGVIAEIGMKFVRGFAEKN